GAMVPRPTRCAGGRRRPARRRPGAPRSPPVDEGRPGSPDPPGGPPGRGIPPFRTAPGGGRAPLRRGRGPLPPRPPPRAVETRRRGPVSLFSLAWIRPFQYGIPFLASGYDTAVTGAR